jgi:hypothetical protein
VALLWHSAKNFDKAEDIWQYDLEEEAIALEEILRTHDAAFANEVEYFFLPKGSSCGQTRFSAKPNSIYS